MGGEIYLRGEGAVQGLTGCQSTYLPKDRGVSTFGGVIHEPPRVAKAKGRGARAEGRTLDTERSGGPTYYRLLQPTTGFYGLPYPTDGRFGIGTKTLFWTMLDDAGISGNSWK